VGRGDIAQGRVARHPPARERRVRGEQQIALRREPAELRLSEEGVVLDLVEKIVACSSAASTSDSGKFERPTCRVRPASRTALIAASVSSSGTARDGSG
jgi:hypothetical protein